jgi:hypothetical protein
MIFCDARSLGFGDREATASIRGGIEQDATAPCSPIIGPLWKKAKKIILGEHSHRRR